MVIQLLRKKDMRNRGCASQRRANKCFVPTTIIAVIILYKGYQFLLYLSCKKR